MKENLIYGLHSVKATLNQNPDRILKLIVVRNREDNRMEELLNLAKQHNIFIEERPRESLDKLAETTAHQGIIAECRARKILNEDDLTEFLNHLQQPPFLLILDNVQDPHNLGACLRSADAAGVQGIIIPKDKSVSITPTVEKIASGAAETIPVFQVTNLARTMRFLKEKNIWLYGFSDKAQQNFYQADLRGPLALVLGAEGSGMRQLTTENCDALYAIPMAGSVSSLNVSVAAGVVLFEAVRQRN